MGPEPAGTAQGKIAAAAPINCGDGVTATCGNFTPAGSGGPEALIAHFAATIVDRAASAPGLRKGPAAAGLR